MKRRSAGSPRTTSITLRVPAIVVVNCSIRGMLTSVSLARGRR